MPRSAVLVLAVAAAVIATKLVAENLFGLDLGTFLTRSAEAPGVGAGLAIFSLLAVDILLPVPSSVVMVAAGSLFGVAGGAALSLVGSIGGEWLGFELVRRYGRRASRGLIGDEELVRLTAVMRRHGAMAIVISRALPVVMETMSVVAGLSGMPRTTFLVASLIGTAPIVVVYAWAGAVARETGDLVPVAVVLLAVGAAGWVMWSRSSRRSDPPSSVASHD